MFKIIAIATLLVITQFSHAAEISEEKKLVINEMLEITGSLKMAETMGTAAATQMIQLMSQGKKDFNPRIIEIAKEVIGNIMHEEFISNRFLHKMSYRIYDKYFTTSDLKEIVAFYKTPIGKKLILHLPKASQEAMTAGMLHGQSLGPLIKKRLIARFEKEDIKI